MIDICFLKVVYLFLREEFISCGEDEVGDDEEDGEDEEAGEEEEE